MINKTDDAYKSIGEVAKILDLVNTHYDPLGSTSICLILLQLEQRT